MLELLQQLSNGYYRYFENLLIFMRVKSIFLSDYEYKIKECVSMKTVLATGLHIQDEVADTLWKMWYQKG